MHFPRLLVLLKGSDFLAPYMYVQLMFSYLWGFSCQFKVWWKEVHAFHSKSVGIMYASTGDHFIQDGRC